MPRIAGRVAAGLSLLPTLAILAVCFYGFIAWTAVISFTGSRLLPRYDFVGSRNYRVLFEDVRFYEALEHLVLFGVLFVGLAVGIGLLLAFSIDRLGPGRGVGALRAIIVYPVAMSWLVTGLVWQWILNPDLGLERTVRALGWRGFSFDYLVRENTALYALVAAALWHVSGIVAAVLLAGLRTVDPEIWKAARVEGIPRVQIYLRLMLPMLRPHLLTVIMLLCFMVVRTFDLVVAMTGGGPGFATDMPALYTYDYLFTRGRLGIGAASAIVLLLATAAVLAPYLGLELGRRRRG